MRFLRRSVAADEVKLQLPPDDSSARLGTVLCCEYSNFLRRCLFSAELRQTSLAIVFSRSEPSGLLCLGTLGFRHSLDSLKASIQKTWEEIDVNHPAVNLQFCRTSSTLDDEAENVDKQLLHNKELFYIKLLNTSYLLGFNDNGLRQHFGHS